MLCVATGNASGHVPRLVSVETQRKACEGADGGTRGEREAGDGMHEEV